MEKRICESIADGITLIRGLKHECCMWLIEGQNKALLIDTGIGYGGLKEEVEELTSLPCYVANTHGHGDHSGGNYEFETVYIHKKAMEWARDAFQMTRSIVDREKAEEVRAHIMNHPPEFVALKEGDFFDLGSRKIHIYETPGHTAGDLVFVDEETGLAFCGDFIMHRAGPLLTEPDQVAVSDFYRSLLKVKAIPGISGFCSGHDRHIIPLQFLDECIECAARILNGTADIMQVDAGLPKAGIMCLRAEWRSCSIRFFKEKPFKPIHQNN